MFTELLTGFFDAWPTWAVPVLGGFLGICVLIAFVLFFVSEVKKRTARKRKHYADMALFALLVGLYGVFYVVKILYAQQLSTFF